MAKITLSSEQQAAYKLLESSNGNYFVTGKAGSGKSVLLRYFISHTKKRTAVCAPTGIAAINVGGQTLHSFFGLSIFEQDSRKTSTVNCSNALKQILNSLDCLVIDEVSMIRADIMDMIDAKLRNARGKALPFGGCQVILFGDLYQLPPILVGNALVSFVITRFHGKYFFNAPVVAEASFKVIELTEVIRQKDPEFISLLNDIRLGNSSKDILERINKRVLPVPEGKHVVTLTATRDKAAQINAQCLDELPGEKRIYKADYSGEFAADCDSQTVNSHSFENLPADPYLELKIGAQVMMIKNDLSGEKNWVNGTVGEVCDMTDGAVYVRIGGKVFCITKEQWTKYRYTYDSEKHEVMHEPVGIFEQYPLCLAYAMTIHKSQGQTYDAINIDLSNGKAFESGQVYVALSRCRTLEGIYLARPFDAFDISSNQFIKEYLEANPPIALDTDSPVPEPTVTTQIPENTAAVSELASPEALPVIIPETDQIDLCPDTGTSPDFLPLLMREPLIYKASYFSSLRNCRHTPYVDFLINALEHEVLSYRKYYTQLLYGSRHYENYKEMLIKRSCDYSTVSKSIKAAISDIIQSTK